MSRDLAAVFDHPDADWDGAGVHFPDRLTTVLHRDHAHRFLPHLLHFGDAISMAHSVESRLPFLDHRLVEFVFGLPFDAKMRGGVTKHVLREALAGTLPSEIARRRDKVGFATPWAEWLRPQLDREIRPRLAWERVRDRGIFDEDGLDRCLADFEAGRKDAAWVIFRCLALDAWFELFVDGEGFRNGRGVADRPATIGSSSRNGP
jgi:asparagine synthase (glutamine-hydrolysing)